MIKIYDKILLVIAVLVLAGGGFLYMQELGVVHSLRVPANVQIDNNPYIPVVVSSPTPIAVSYTHLRAHETS